MAISATFTANFDQMVGASKTAEAALKNVEGAGTRVGLQFDEMGVASDKTAPRVHNLRTALSSFDGVLAAMGVNIGSEIRGLTELGDAAGQTFTQLGLITTAGLAAGAALGGWKIGRLVSDFFGLDTAIANTTAKLLGYGDVSAEVAGAQQDTINKAIKDGAAANITYAQAVAFNTAKQKEHLAALAKAGEVHKQHEAELKRIQAEEERWGLVMAELNAVGGTLTKTLDGMSGTVVEAIKFYLEAGVSQNVLAEAYGVTASQIRAISAAMKEEKDWLDFEEAAKKRNIEITKQMTAATNDLVIAKLKEAQAQEAANAAFLARELAAAMAADQAMFGGGGGISPEIHGNIRNPILTGGGGGFGNGGLHPLSGLHPLRAGGGSVSTGQSYVVGERGPELFTPGANGFVTPNGGGTVVNNYIYVNGTAEEVARKVAAEFTRTMKSSTKVKVTQ